MGVLKGPAVGAVGATQFPRPAQQMGPRTSHGSRVDPTASRNSWLAQFYFHCGDTSVRPWERANHHKNKENDRIQAEYKSSSAWIQMRGLIIKYTTDQE